MPPEEEKVEDEGEDWAPEREETAPEFMEPLVEVDEGDLMEADLTKGRRERDARDSALYRERRVVEEVVEEEGEGEAKPARGPTRAQRRAERERLKLEREVQRMERQHDPGIRSSMAYKTFYDMVCNRVGVIVAGFGVAMILFTVSYDWLQGREFSLGAKHWLALVISIVVYGTGMGLEGLRVLSPECEGLEARALAAQAAGETDGPVEARAEEPEHIPMIPEDAVEKLLEGNRR